MTEEEKEECRCGQHFSSNQNRLVTARQSESRSRSSLPDRPRTDVKQLYSPLFHIEASWKTKRGLTALTTSPSFSRTGLLRLIRFSSCFSLHLHALLEARSRMALNAERFSTTVRVHIWFQTCLVGLVSAAPVRYREFLVSQTYSNLLFFLMGMSAFREPSRIDVGQTTSRMPNDCPPACCQRFCCPFGVHPTNCGFISV